MVAISRRGELGAANGAGGAAVLLCLLRASAEAKEKQKTKCDAGRLTGARWGLMWRATAHRGLASQRNTDALPSTRRRASETVGTVAPIQFDHPRELAGLTARLGALQSTNPWSISANNLNNN